MASVSVVNPKADILRKTAALAANCNASRGLMELLKSNLGPRGTLKMLVGGAGQIKITKDGNVLLHEMQIQHPTAAMIARASTAQDTITGDGTTSTVIMIGEIFRQAEMYLSQGVHPRIICDGIDIAKTQVLEFLEKIKIPCVNPDRELLQSVAKTSLRTKLIPKLADQLTDIVVDAVLCIKQENSPIDLFMIEILHMCQQHTTDSRFIRGMVMDHGARHPDMPKKLKDCYVLTCNVSLEYEKTEVNTEFHYSSADQRSRLVQSERRFTDEKVMKIIELKRKVCNETNNKNFVVFNQKGIDPPSLEMLAKENIFALRRVKRRNMERLTLCCGGNAVNCVDDLSVEDLGFAGDVYEECIDDEKWTFVENVTNPQSCAILVKGPNDFSISQIKDAIRDGLRAVKNTIEDSSIIPGAGAFEAAAYSELQNYARTHMTGKIKYGVLAFSEAMLVIPKTIAMNSGFDAEEIALKLTETYEKTKKLCGVDVYTGEAINPTLMGIYDNFCVKRQSLALCSALTEQLLLVDEIIKAGKQMGGSN